MISSYLYIITYYFIPKPQIMKNLISNKTLQATYGGDVIGGSVVPGMLGAFFYIRIHHGPLIRTFRGRTGGCGSSGCRCYPRYHHPAIRLDSSERKMHEHPRSHGSTHNLILEGVQLGMLLLLKTVSKTRLQDFYSVERKV